MDNNNTRYYYVREHRNWIGPPPGSEGNHPIACVCIIRDENGDMWRGVSICSRKDNFVKATARKIARRNAEFLRSLNKETGAVKILGRIGSESLRRAVKKLKEKNCRLTNSERTDRFYEKASAVSEIPLSPFERRIWDDPALTNAPDGGPLN